MFNGSRNGSQYSGANLRGLGTMDVTPCRLHQVNLVADIANTLKFVDSQLNLVSAVLGSRTVVVLL